MSLLTSFSWLNSFIAPEMGQRITGLICHFLWQGTLVAAGASFTDLLIQKWSASNQHRCHVAWFLLLILCVPATWWYAEGTALTQSAMSAIEPAQVASSVIIGAGDSTPANPQIDPRLEFSNTLTGFVACVYVIGSVGMVLRMVLSCFGVYHLRRFSEPLIDPRITFRMRELCKETGFARQPDVRVCTRLAVPIVLGIVKPVILLPPFALSGMTKAELDAILFHELAHLRRGDLLINCLQRITETLLFFHPVTWHLSRKISTSRERCCDDMVVTRCDRRKYAGALVRLAEHATDRNSQIWSLAASGKPSDLRLRISRILCGDNSDSRSREGTATGVVGAIMIILFAIAVHAQTNNAAYNPVGPDHSANRSEQGSEDVTHAGLTMLRSVELADETSLIEVSHSIDSFIRNNKLTNGEVIEYRFQANSLIVHSSDKHFELIQDLLVKNGWMSDKAVRNRGIQKGQKRPMRWADPEKIHPQIMNQETDWDSFVANRINHGKRLFEMNCKHCHGRDGDGSGPTAAFLSPKPRDFTKRKFARDNLDSPQRHAELIAVIRGGIPGSSMPAFKLLSTSQVHVLSEYVIYLSAGKKIPQPPKSNLLFSPDIEKGMLIDGLPPNVSPPIRR